MLIDETLLRFDNIWAADGTPNAVFRLTPADLVALTGGLWMWRMADRVLSLSITRADAAVQEEICDAAQGSKMRGFGARDAFERRSYVHSPPRNTEPYEVWY